MKKQSKKTKDTAYGKDINICINPTCKLRKQGCRGFEGCPGYKGKDSSEDETYKIMRLVKG